VKGSENKRTSLLRRIKWSQRISCSATGRFNVVAGPIEREKTTKTDIRWVIKCQKWSRKCIKREEGNDEKGKRGT